MKSAALVLAAPAVLAGLILAPLPRAEPAAAPQGAQAPGNPTRSVPAPKSFAIRAAKALVVGEDGRGVIDGAVVLVVDGKIQAIGPAREIEIPEGWEVVDCGRSWICPGFIDLHCHIAGQSFLVNDINDMVYMTNPGLRASAAVRPGNPDLLRAVAGGVTSVLFIPGSGTNMGGQGVLLKTGLATFDRMVIRNPGSLKLAQAGNPERWAIGVGRSLMNWNTRNTFERGVDYAERRAAADKGGDKAARDIHWDVFPWLITKQVPISTHTQRYQVVLATLTMVKKELGLNVFIDHGEWYGSKLAGYARDLGVDAILGPRAIDLFNSLDTDGKILGIAASYQQGGHPNIGFNTDSPVIPQEELPLQAAIGVRFGFDDSRLDSLRGLTIVPATTAGIQARVGSLAPGKDADILVTTGDPVDPRHSVEIVWIEGRRVYDAAADGRMW